MNMVNIHEAKTHLSRLVDKAASGEPFIIAKSGRPLVKVVSCEAPERTRRLGFLRGQGVIRAGIKEVGVEEISELFGG
ncbi:MAG: type II toxin-antitoxin system prevent-host-death family antitoxin [Acidobacteria bacterium]|nr:type II toxin-antitoxin system prevent-host-death family antitoxin [Acidobacteriota bacterium]